MKKTSIPRSSDTPPEVVEVMQRCAQARLVNTGLPVKHLQAKPSTKGEWGDKLIMLTNRLNTGGMMFALIGQRGTGKTQMAAELIRYEIGRASCRERVYHPV